MKRCSKCGKEKPLDEFYARKVGRGGKSSECKDCASAYNRQWRARNPQKVAVYKERHKEIQRKAWKAWRARNPDKVAVWSRRWQERERSDPVLRARKIERDLQWRKNNPERFRARVAVANSRRREARRAMRGDADVRAYTLVLMHDPCSYCGARMEHVDHIVPHASGATTVWDNLTAACARCNRSKGTKSLLRFLAA